MKQYRVITAQCCRCNPPVPMVKAGPLWFICPQCENVCKLTFATRYERSQ